MSASDQVQRLRKVAGEFNLGTATVVEFLEKKGFVVESNPNAKITPEMYNLLEQNFKVDRSVKEQKEKLVEEYRGRKVKKTDHDGPEENDTPAEPTAPVEQPKTIATEIPKPKVVDKIDLSKFESKRAPKQEAVEPPKPPISEQKTVEPIAAEPAKQAPPKASEVAEEKKIEKPEFIVATEKPVEEVKPTIEKVEIPSPEKIEKPEVKEVTEQVAKEVKTHVAEKVDVPPIIEAEEPIKASTTSQIDEVKVEVAPKAEDKEEAPAAPKVHEKGRTFTAEESAEAVGLKGPKVLGMLDLDSMNQKTRPPKKSRKQREAEEAAKKEVALAKRKAEQQSRPSFQQQQRPQQHNQQRPEFRKDNPNAAAGGANAKTDSTDTRFIKPKVDQLSGPRVVGKIDLPDPKSAEKKKLPVGSSSDSPQKKAKENDRKKRRRIKTDVVAPDAAKKPGDNRPNHHNTNNTANNNNKNRLKKKIEPKPELSEEDISKQIKETLARLSDTTKSKGAKYRRQKRDAVSQNTQREMEEAIANKQIIKVTEFVSANEIASMMNTSVNEIIKVCMSLGMFVSINQRLDAETISIVAGEFGFKVEFVGAKEVEESIQDIVDKEEDLKPRNPIVTVMGHVDHGKTSLLDYIRKTNVIAGEAGGITQHIGAYEVELVSGEKITFLDTPGHEAFTAMRARGSKITDIAVIVIAADDAIMPQTKEAITHAQAAGVPIIFAINKVDKPNAQPEKIKEGLASMNLLVEDWGGKYQSQDISAKHGMGVDTLMEKILLEAEMLDLKANPNRFAVGTILEASLDKGKGYVSKILVQNGTLKVGDVVLAGTTYGRVKAMYNERNKVVKEAGPATPVLLLGLNSAPQAGDSFRVMADEKEARNIALKREQLQREQGVRTQKHITLDEIGRRLAVGDFKELNVIIKGDVDGSVEALADSLVKLSTAEIQVNIIHKSVGQVNEADVILASASDAIIVAFQVRPSVSARQLAEKEQIDIRIYSIIYNVIDEVKAAMEGMLSPDLVEEILCSVEVREVFKITKVGTVAGCYVLDGKIQRNSKIRIIRDGIVIYSGILGSLKRFKDDAKEVSKGFECGLNIDNYNNIEVGDIIEGYDQKEVKRTL
jgi:translation initiation factor IF-2